MNKKLISRAVLVVIDPVEADCSVTILLGPGRAKGRIWSKL